MCVRTTKKWTLKTFKSWLDWTWWLIGGVKPSLFIVHTWILHRRIVHPLNHQKRDSRSNWRKARKVRISESRKSGIIYVVRLQKGWRIFCKVSLRLSSFGKNLHLTSSSSLTATANHSKDVRCDGVVLWQGLFTSCLPHHLIDNELFVQNLPGSRQYMTEIFSSSFTNDACCDGAKNIHLVFTDIFNYYN